MKRAYGGGGAVSSGRAFKSPYKAAAFRGKYVVPGVTRVGGFYGRYNVRGRRATGAKGNELKFFDTALNFSFDGVAEVPATGQLNLIPQGVTESTRVGRKCVLKSIHILGSVTTPGAGAAPDSLCIMVVLDKQCNGAAAAVADVLTQASLTAAYLDNALTNLENSERFVILKKVVLKGNPYFGIATVPGQAEVVHMDYYKKCNISLEFDSTASTGAIGTIRSNNVFLIAGANRTDDVYSFIGNCRVRFADG